ncbi:MAG: CDP-diacylglycerol--serine O-phosphatidyltransferase [Bacteroidales bacterium]|nr:CDP-diacylglycerol--serine O-phosphatidyltransferase [Bacteroidales bacterium]
MNKIIIPNAVTSLNIISGTLAILVSLRYPEYLYVASILVFLASVFDFFDGFLARLLNAQSEFGKQMDSLSDLVSFGLAPTFIMFNLIQNATTNPYLPYISFIIVVLSAIRLAIFNITNQKDSFNGLPTPALAIFVVSIPLILKFPQISHIINIDSVFIFENLWILISSTLILSILLVTNIKMLSLKFKNFKFQENRIRYILLIISVLLLIVFVWLAIPFIIIVYIFLSVLEFNQKKQKK